MKVIDTCKTLQDFKDLVALRKQYVDFTDCMDYIKLSRHIQGITDTAAELYANYKVKQALNQINKQGGTMKPTEQEIENEANMYQVDEYDCGNTGDLARAFKEGAEWSISQMQPEWVSVEDRLPDKRQYVVISYWSGYDIAEFKHGLFFVGLEKITDVTHWKPLSPPTTK